MGIVETINEILSLGFQPTNSCATRVEAIISRQDISRIASTRTQHDPQEQRTSSGPDHPVIEIIEPRLNTGHLAIARMSNQTG